MLFFAGAEFGRSTPHESAARGVSLGALGAVGGSSLRGNSTLLPAGLTAECYTFTGITCDFEPCGGSRHAECEEHKCMCVTSGCAGVDGSCHPGIYRTVASGFYLYNAKYDWQHMYFPPLSVLGEIKVSAIPTMFSPDKWVLHEVPGAAKPKAYFLSSEAYPDWVANIQATRMTAFSLFGAYEDSLGKELEPEVFAVRVCSLPDGKIKIGSYKQPVEWFYVHHGSWNVYGWGLTNDPGDGGHWVPQPAMPDGEFEPCD